MTEKHPYNPQSICDTKFPRSESKCYSYSNTWDSFVEACFKHFAKQAVKLSPINPPAASDLVLLANNHEPDHIKLDTSVENILTHKSIVEYYAELMACFSTISAQNGSKINNNVGININSIVRTTMPDMAEALNMCMINNISYVHLYGDEYMKIQIKKPYATMHEYLLIIPVAEDWDKEDDDKVEEVFDKFIGMYIYICIFIIATLMNSVVSTIT